MPMPPERDEMSDEIRYTPEEYLQQLMKFYRSQPEARREAEFEEHLQNTLIARYKDASNLLTEVQDLLNELKQRGRINKRQQLEIEQAVSKVDNAIIKLAYGSLRYNKAPETKNVVLWPGDGPYKP
jgi:beta-phosphoglucomutase-like phosphatase (HAD superfamily)